MSTALPQRLATDSFGETTSSRRGEPTWEVARLYPAQGHWSVEEYLALDAAGGRLIEFVDGFLEFPQMPKRIHQRIVRFLMRVIEEVIRSGAGGEVLDAPFPVYVEPNRYREPDIVFQRAGRPDAHSDYADGADLVIEVVSDDARDRERDLVTKRAEYAQARIPEYWIVDPETRLIHVLTLDGVESGGPYRVHGEFKTGETATSVLLDGFRVSVDDVFRAGEGEASSSPSAPSGRG
jgi:Uma2 family endonuclease